MSQANVRLVEGIYAASEKRDIAAIFAVLADDAELVQSTEVPWGGTYRGREGVMRFFGLLMSHVATRVEVERFIDAGDHVVAVGRTRGTVVATGAPLDVAVSHVWRVRDGKAVRAEFYIDNPTMLAALAAPKAR
ncbi:MAG: nuclear transport factor 2 family protein [Planctomycetes bacterium]|nr:nuclear transport factor 2 family protein [Planctomycetota bacterium]